MNGGLCRHCGRHSAWWRHEWHHLQGINLSISVHTRARQKEKSESSYGQSAAGARTGRQGHWAAQEVDCVIFGVACRPDVGGEREGEREGGREGAASRAIGIRLSQCRPDAGGGPTRGLGLLGTRDAKGGGGPSGHPTDRSVRGTRRTRLPSHSCDSSESLVRPTIAHQSVPAPSSVSGIRPARDPEHDADHPLRCPIQAFLALTGASFRFPPAPATGVKFVTPVSRTIALCMGHCPSRRTQMSRSMSPCGVRGQNLNSETSPAPDSDQI